jgi:hypothetical protein
MSADREVVVAAGAGAEKAPAVSDSNAEATHALCANCGATVTGHFCANCGQKSEHAIHSLWHFLSEATEDLTHADSRLWQTIGALLFKPGFLTTEFLAGRRVKYLPPIRLYLVMSVLCFLIAAIGNGNGKHNEPTAAEIARFNAQIANTKAQYKRKTGHDLVIDGRALKLDEEGRQQRLANCAEVQAEARNSGPLKAAVLSVAYKACVSSAEDNGHALVEAFLHNLPRALFVTLPIMAALMKLLYRRPRRYYVAHLLFLLHNYSFVFLSLAILIFLGWIITTDIIMGPLSVILPLYALYYIFSGMRHVYPESVGRTIVKFTVLSSGYLIVALCALVATAVYSVLVQ